MGYKVPAGITSKHVHLSQKDWKVLFGKDSEMTVFKTISQPGQFACNEKVDIVGPKGTLQSVRVLGPIRPSTQIELAITDCIMSGISAVLRNSGDTAGSSPCKIVGPAGELELSEGCIVMRRHLHLSAAQAAEAGVKDGDMISIKFGGDRGLIFDNVLVRAGDKNDLDMHLDTDEANSAKLSNGQEGEIIK